MESKVITLKKPIAGMKEGETISEIVLKEPTFATLAKIGLPISKDNGLDFAKGLLFVEALSGIHAPILNKMCAADALAVVSASVEMCGTDEEAAKN